MNFKSTVYIDSTPLGEGHPPYIVAELSANHGGQLQEALDIISAAADAGVNAVKLQTYTADTITLDSHRPEFQINQGPRKGQSLYELYQKGSTPWEWHEEIFSFARELGLSVFSSPFDHSAVDFLENLGCPAYKIASFEIVDLPLIRKVAETGKPIIMSTGMASQQDIKEALEVCDRANNKQVVVLHCVSGYPTPVEETNLSTLQLLRENFKTIVGLSDHTLSLETSIGAVALGAAFIEKHITLDRNEGRLDASFSLEPEEFSKLVKSSRITWSAMGQPSFNMANSEAYTSRLRRSLYAVKNIKAGEKLTHDNIRSVRPNSGLAPKHYDQLIGSHAKVDISENTPLDWSLIEK